MLGDAELLVLLGDLVSHRVERKQSLADKAKVCQAICAFANDYPETRQPGVVFIGVNDDGSCAELDVTDELLLEVRNIRGSGQIQPLPDMTVGKREVGGCMVVVVEVQPSPMPPVRYNGRTWIRTGPSRDTATVEQEARLSERRRFGNLPFDAQPVPTATLDDLDLDLFERQYLPQAVAPDVLAANERSTEHQLRALRLTADDRTPTALGLLVAGRDVRYWLPGAYVQFLRIDGTDLTDPVLDQAEIDGPLAQLLTRLDDKLKAHIQVATQITGTDREIRRPTYPLEALQQIARNAVMHRAYAGTNAAVRLTWFNDRIEVQSPGGPFGQVTVANFGQPGAVDYRNPNLAEAMKNLGYVQRFGVGLAIARRALADNGNPPPEFVAVPEHVLVTVRSAA